MSYAARFATLALTVVAFLFLTWGSITTVRLYFDTGEGPGFAWILVWPLTLVLFALPMAAALVTAGRLRAGFIPLVLLLGGDVLCWFVGMVALVVAFRLMLGWDDTQSNIAGAIVLVLAFDLAAINLAWQFLFRGGPDTILGC